MRVEHVIDYGQYDYERHVRDAMIKLINAQEMVLLYGHPSPRIEVPLSNLSAQLTAKDIQKIIIESKDSETASQAIMDLIMEQQEDDYDW
jgi:hypothetical protein